jgi:hypothetical protein
MGENRKRKGRKFFGAPVIDVQVIKRNFLGA